MSDQDGRIPDESAAAADSRRPVALTRPLKETIYGLFLRGVTVEAIADDTRVDFERVSKVIADRLTVSGKDDEQHPDRKAAGDSLRALKRNLWAAMQTAPNKAAYANALARIESAIMRTDGRCGAKLKGGPGFCSKYPVEGRTRCDRHGGKSLKAGPTHPRWIHGIYSRARTVPVDSDEQKLLAEYEAEGNNIAKQIAIQKLVQHRALLMGDPSAASTAGAALASMIRAQRDAGRPPVDLEAAMDRVAIIFVDVVLKHVEDPLIRAAIMRDFSGVNWKDVSVPTLPETQPAPAERT